ncbi:MAG: cyclase family protein [Saprospiraceae bacterium]|nr:cyclase family protein [Saprospiraceae bacterium]
MKINVTYNNETFTVDLDHPHDISIPLIPGNDAPNCFWAPLFEASPVVAGDWIGDVNQGGGVNFKNVRINPHGNGTHTECVGHISKEEVTINSVLKNFHFISQLISVYPEKLDNGDKVITRSQIIDVLENEAPEALIIRTLPNGDDKMRRVYSGSNPAYIHHEAIELICELGVKHLLIDLPSVDREEDEGKLLSHKAFWDYPAKIDKEKTITELIYVDNVIPDGIYLLNLQIVSFELDASPSKPVIYRINKSDR